MMERRMNSERRQKEMARGNDGCIGGEAYNPITNPKEKISTEPRKEKLPLRDLR